METEAPPPAPEPEPFAPPASYQVEVELFDEPPRAIMANVLDGPYAVRWRGLMPDRAHVRPRGRRVRRVRRRRPARLLHLAARLPHVDRPRDPRDRRRVARALSPPQGEVRDREGGEGAPRADRGPTGRARSLLQRAADQRALRDDRDPPSADGKARELPREVARAPEPRHRRGAAPLHAREGRLRDRGLLPVALPGLAHALRLHRPEPRRAVDRPRLALVARPRRDARPRARRGPDRRRLRLRVLRARAGRRDHGRHQRSRGPRDHGGRHGRAPTPEERDRRSARREGGVRPRLRGLDPLAHGRRGALARERRSRSVAGDVRGGPGQGVLAADDELPRPELRDRVRHARGHEEDHLHARADGALRGGTHGCARAARGHLRVALVKAVLPAREVRDGGKLWLDVVQPDDTSVLVPIRR